MALLVIGIAFSTAMMALLCRGDPKRLRAYRQKAAGLASSQRWVLALAAVAPGLAFALSGNAPAVLIWLGGTAMAGWLVTMWASGTATRETE